MGQCRQRVTKLTSSGLLLLVRLLLLLRLWHHLHAGWEGMVHAGDALHVRHPQLVLLLLVPATEHTAHRPLSTTKRSGLRP